MNEEDARKILGDIVQEDNSLYAVGLYIGRDEAMLDGSYDADTLEAIAWWMRNKI